MAFNSLEYLEASNVDFIYQMTAYDKDKLIEHIRKSDNKIKIINGFLYKLRDVMSDFCFKIIYDIDEFVDDAKYLLDTYYIINSLSKEQFELFLNNSSLGINYLKEHIEEIINKFQKDLDFVFKFMFNNLAECL